MTKSKNFDYTFDDNWETKNPNGKVKLRLHTEDEFAQWMGSKEAFPFDPEQLTLTRGENSMVQFAYAMYKYAVEVHNGDRDPGSNEITADYTIPFQQTQVTNQVSEIGMRQQKTIYNGDIDMLYAEGDFFTPRLLNLYDSNGKLEILQFREVEERELNSLFLTYGWVYFGFQLFACVPQLGIDEIMNASIVHNQEMRARILLEPHCAKFLSTKLGEPVDVYIDQKYVGTPNEELFVYRLFKGRIGDDDVTYVNCFCPSTGREFMLGVRNQYTNARDAIASLLQLPKDTLQYVDKIFRQGEVFAVTYTGIKTSSKEFKKANESQLVPLSGDFYFSKLAFES